MHPPEAHFSLLQKQKHPLAEKWIKAWNAVFHAGKGPLCHFVHLLWQMWKNFVVPVIKNFLYIIVQFGKIILQIHDAPLLVKVFRKIILH